MKTNAMRMLDSARIKYDVLEYSIDKDMFSGEKVSDLLNIDYKTCYKTLALKHDKDIYICVVSVADEIDLKKCAKSLNVKKLEMVHVKELLQLVGYERGSVSPIGAKRNKGVYFDLEVLKHEEIEISGGLLGIGLKIKTTDLLKYLNAKVVDIAK